MAESFCTDMVPVPDRLEAWLFKARQICGDCRFEFPRRRAFHGSIERRTVGGVELTRFASAAVSFRKFPAVAAGSLERDCVIITQLQGARTYYQGGACVTLTPGDATIVDTGEPWSSCCTDDCSRLYMRVPLVVFDHCFHPKMPSLPRISGRRGTGATLLQMITSLYKRADSLAHSTAVSEIGAYLDLLLATLASSQSSATAAARVRALDSRIERFIEFHLADTTLNPHVIAAAMGISVRHLHRVFSAKGRTPGDWIRERRLDRCRAQIADQRFSATSITDIAFSWGFSDSAHFSRCFRQRFGISARELRAEARRSPEPQFFRLHNSPAIDRLN